MKSSLRIGLSQPVAVDLNGIKAAVQFIQEYRRSIKSVRVEELVDLFFYRPLAWLLVAVFKHTPITPNQISLIGMATGIVSGCFMARGDRHSMLVGGLLYGLSNVIDCSDGMIARIKKSGSKTGRIVDGAADYVISIAVYIGFAIGLTRGLSSGEATLPFHPWLLIVLAGSSTALHSVLSDKYRNLYENHVYGKYLSPETELEEFGQEYERLKREGGSRLDLLLIGLYLHYCRLQTASGSKPFHRFDPAAYSRYNSRMVMLWNLVGPATHITLLMTAAILFQPWIFFWYTIVWANLWVALLYPLQKYLDRKLAADCGDV